MDDTTIAKSRIKIWVTPGAFLTGIGEPIDFVVA
jgi:phosphotransferase system  glucose/maltose/N-acetylglucosamine-specific IIC component